MMRATTVTAITNTIKPRLVLISSSCTTANLSRLRASRQALLERSKCGELCLQPFYLTRPIPPVLCHADIIFFEFSILRLGGAYFAFRCLCSAHLSCHRLTYPILFGFTFHCRGFRVFDLHPMR